MARLRAETSDKVYGKDEEFAAGKKADSRDKPELGLTEVRSLPSAQQKISYRAARLDCPLDVLLSCAAYRRRQQKKGPAKQREKSDKKPIKEGNTAQDTHA